VIDNDDDLYDRVRTEFDEVHLQNSLDDITARGRGLLRRRHAATALGVAVLAAGVAAGLTLSRPAGPPPGITQVAAWTVDARTDGTVVFTVRQLVDADQLSAALKKAGVPALVEFIKVPREQGFRGCQPDGQEAMLAVFDVMTHGDLQAKPGENTYAVLRDRMPPGSVLHFVIFEEVGTDGVATRVVRFSLIDGDPLPCRLYPPDVTG
jgi:hypothetical protein